MVRGRDLKAIQKRLRLKDAEVCAEAKVSMGTLVRVYNEHPTVTEATVQKVVKGLETLRRQLAVEINTKVAG